MSAVLDREVMGAKVCLAGASRSVLTKSVATQHLTAESPTQHNGRLGRKRKSGNAGGGK